MRDGPEIHTKFSAAVTGKEASCKDWKIKLEDEIITNVNKTRFEDVRWIELAQNNARW